MKYTDTALASSQTSSAVREETLESRGEVSEGKRASRGEERMKMMENIKRGKEMEKQR